ncbi:MAG: hypothetical protein GXP62_01385, partial [Oligoflexia bacterium]|nr:hypothetical protein [Oligoflexia bacterium]
PVMLHEIAGGRTLSGAVWPGLLALGLLAQGRIQSVLGGLLIGLQGLFYVYTGLLFGLVALILCPAWGLLAAAIPMIPYLWWLSPVWSDAQTRPPDAGFTRLPVAGLLGLARVQERFRLHPALLIGLPALLAARGRQALRLGAVIALLVLIALGPNPTWDGGGALFTSPMAWAGELFPPLARMHHPIRAALVLVPLLAVGLSRLLDRLPWPAVLATALLALPMRHAVELGAPWSAMVEPEGLTQARWIADHTDDQHIGAIVDLTGNQGGALALQPIHQRPMLEGLRKELPDKDRQVGWLRRGVDPWLSGQRVAPSTLKALRQAGFTHVLVVPRGTVVPLDGVEADLGSPVFPGVYTIPTGTEE